MPRRVGDSLKSRLYQEAKRLAAEQRVTFRFAGQWSQATISELIPYVAELRRQVLSRPTRPGVVVPFTAAPNEPTHRRYAATSPAVRTGAYRTRQFTIVDSLLRKPIKPTPADRDTIIVDTVPINLHDPNPEDVKVVENKVGAMIDTFEQKRVPPVPDRYKSGALWTLMLAVMERIKELADRGVPLNHVSGFSLLYAPIVGEDEGRGTPVWRFVRYEAGDGPHKLLAKSLTKVHEHEQYVAFTKSDYQYAGSLYDDIDPNTFRLSWWAPLRGATPGKAAGKKFETKYYKCVDHSTEGGHCLIDIFRRFKKVGKQVKTLLREHGHAPGEEIPPSALDWLEPLFGVTFDVISGDEIDVDRKFIDNKTSNRCVAKAKEKVLRPSRRDKYPNMGKIALTRLEDGSGHYVLVEDAKSVVFHPVTGLEYTEEPGNEQIIESLQVQGRALCDRLARQVGRKRRVLAYDIETVYDVVGNIVPYACSWIVFNADEPPADFSKCDAKIAISDDPNDPSKNPLNGVLDEIENAPRDTVYVLEAYNGAAFDHLALAQLAAERDRFSKLSWYGGKIYGGSIGRHPMHDLCRFTTCSLARACDSFKTNPKKVAGFSHEAVQAEYFAGRFGEWLAANRAQLENYAKNDVLSLGDLVVKSRNAFRTLTGRDLLEFPTIGKMAWDTWKEGLHDKGKKSLYRPETRDIDKFMRAAMTAGRVQVMIEDGKPCIYVGQMRVVDFKSLYPTVCLAMGFGDEVFPIGTPAWTGEYVEGKCGIYNVHITSQDDGKPNVIPRRDADDTKPLDWRFKGEFDTVLTSVDIEMLRLNGAEFTVGDGYVWEESSGDLFKRYFTPIAAEKNRQDALKIAKSGEYNAALRECCKLLMNCLTGKVAQRSRDSVTQIVKGEVAQHEFKDKYDDVEQTPLYGETLIMTGKVKAGAWNRTKAKPCYLACFIYAYARRCLFDLLPYSFYCDTDSGFMTLENYERFRANYPHRFPAEGEDAGFGHVAEELTEKGAAHEYRAYFIQPKTYAIYALDENGKYLPGSSKVRAKGIRPSDVLISSEEAGELEHTDVAGKFARYTGAPRRFAAEEASESFMRQMYENGNATVLCSQIRRSLTHDQKAFVLRQVYTVKKMSVGA